jgi:N-acetyl-D-muramate 6-phosphate phosphatase
MRLGALLFDLDGTLLDSAPDLAGTANDMLRQRGRAPLPYEQLRPHAGSGARGMLTTAFSVQPQDEAYAALRDEFHDRYEARMLQKTQLFEAVHALVGTLEKMNCPWGIVTNKSLRFSAPLVKAMAPLSRAHTLVGGDSTPHTKPHPEPLLEAARRLGVSPQACAYVGDDPRDMQAAHAAGMQAWAAAWGYLGLQLPVDQWRAHHVFNGVQALIAHLQTSELA